MATVNEKMTAIADQVRQLSGVTSALGLDTMAQTIQTENELFDTNLQQQNELVSNIITALDNKVISSTQAYEEGKKAQYDLMWDTLQKNGTLTYYDHAFANRAWTNDIWWPKYDMNVVYGYMMFWGGGLEGDLVELLKERGVTLSTANATSTQYMFASTKLTRIGVVDLSKATTTHYTFQNSKALHTIDEVIFSSVTVPQGSMFDKCSALENVTFSGVIAKSGLNMSSCTLLTHDSIMSIINILADYAGSGTTYTLTLGATNLAKLTDAEKAIATQKGWTLA